MPILKKIFRKRRKKKDKLTKADKEHLKKVQKTPTKIKVTTRGTTTGKTNKKGKSKLKQKVYTKSKHDSKHHKSRRKTLTITKGKKQKFIEVVKQKNKDTGEVMVTDSKGRLYTGKKAKRKYKRISKKIKRKTKNLPKTKIKKK